jgi:hypothetical protein
VFSLRSSRRRFAFIRLRKFSLSFWVEIVAENSHMYEIEEKFHLQNDDKLKMIQKESFHVCVRMLWQCVRDFFFFHPFFENHKSNTHKVGVFVA